MKPPKIKNPWPLTPGPLTRRRPRKSPGAQWAQGAGPRFQKYSFYFRWGVGWGEGAWPQAMTRAMTSQPGRPRGIMGALRTTTTMTQRWLRGQRWRRTRVTDSSGWAGRRAGGPARPPWRQQPGRPGTRRRGSAAAVRGGRGRGGDVTGRSGPAHGVSHGLARWRTAMADAALSSSSPRVRGGACVTSSPGRDLRVGGREDSKVSRHSRAQGRGLRSAPPSVGPCGVICGRPRPPARHSPEAWLPPLGPAHPTHHCSPPRGPRLWAVTSWVGCRGDIMGRESRWCHGPWSWSSPCLIVENNITKPRGQGHCRSCPCLRDWPAAPCYSPASDTSPKCSRSLLVMPLHQTQHPGHSRDAPASHPAAPPSLGVAALTRSHAPAADFPWFSPVSH
jgi:hypothetical protein